MEAEAEVSHETEVDPLQTGCIEDPAMLLDWVLTDVNSTLLKVIFITTSNVMRH